MKLSRHIKARTHTEKFNWCNKDFMAMSPDYRKIRGRMRNPMDACHWCKHPFKDGEMMAIAQPVKGRNRVLCGNCADTLLKSHMGDKPVG